MPSVNIKFQGIELEVELKYDVSNEVESFEVFTDQDISGLLAYNVQDEIVDLAAQAFEELEPEYEKGDFDNEDRRV